MKKCMAAAVIITLSLMCGCDSGGDPMPQLPPPQTTVRTSSTYTGTTVDFIHVETSSIRRPPNELDMPEFPEFPDMNGADDPFGAEFDALFDGTAAPVEFPQMNVSGADSAGDDLSDTVQTTAVSELFSDISISRADLPYDEMTVTAVVSFDAPETVTDTSVRDTEPETESVSVITEDLQTADTAESYDIRDFMPSAADYPDFDGIFY